MDVAGASIVVTGAGRGIGAALVREFARRGAAGITVSDIDGDAARAVADEALAAGVPATAVAADVTDLEQVRALFEAATERFGRPGVVCSNVGISTGRGLFAGPEVWSRAWETNVLGHIHVAQVALPTLVRRGAGHLMITASAAGLLGIAGDAPYAVTKRAAVALAEWLATTYGGRGVDVSALCPLGVRTDLLAPALEMKHPAAMQIAALAPIIEPEDVARVAADAIADGRFLVLPHPEVHDLVLGKDADPDAWIAGARPHRGRRSPAVSEGVR